MAIFAARVRALACWACVRARGLLVEGAAGTLEEPVSLDPAFEPVAPPTAPDATPTPGTLAGTDGVDPNSDATEGAGTDGVVDTEGGLTKGGEIDGRPGEGAMVEGTGIVGAGTLGLGIGTVGTVTVGTETFGTDTFGVVTVGVGNRSAAALENDPTASAATSTTAKTRKQKTFRVTWSSLPSAAFGGSRAWKHGLPVPVHI